MNQVIELFGDMGLACLSGLLGFFVIGLILGHMVWRIVNDHFISFLNRIEED